MTSKTSIPSLSRSKSNFSAASTSKSRRSGKTSTGRDHASLSRSKSSVSAASARSFRSGKSSSETAVRQSLPSDMKAETIRYDREDFMRSFEMSNPRHTGRSSDSWWGYLSELPFDERIDGDYALPSFSPPISPSTWWEMRIEGSPKNEVDHFELQAASFESKSYGTKKSHSFAKSTKSKAEKKPSSRKCTKKQRKSISSVKSSDSAFYNTPYPGIPSKQTGTAIDEICKGGTAILDLLEKNVCPSDFVDSPTMRRFESNTILWDLQNKIDGVDHQALLNILNRNQHGGNLEGELSYDDFSASSESCPPSPVSFSDVRNIISDLENDASFARNKLLNDGRSSDPIFLRASRSSEKGDNTGFAADEIDRQNRRSDKMSRKALKTHIDRLREVDSKKLLSEPIFSKSKTAKRGTSFLPPSELKAGYTLTANSAEIVPMTVKAKSEQGYENFDHMSILTEERNLYMFPHLHEGRSCIPSMRNLMKKIRSIKSSASLSSVKLLGQSTAESTIHSEPAFNEYVHGYETANHAYVAYLERGENGSELVKMYEHPAPPSFEKMSSEVLVIVDVSTVSRSDCFVRRGEWWGDGSPSPLTLPIIPGSAFVGRVESEGGRHFRQGDRVVSLVRAGANSRHLIIDTGRLVKLSADDLSDDVISCLPEIYLSAFQSLHLGQGKASRYRKHALCRKNILILGGSSTIGRALVEVARAAGADAIYVTGREKEFSSIASVGGLPLSKDPRHWLSILMGKMDIVVGLDDPYGAPQLKYEHIKALNSSGKVVIIGGPHPEHDLLDIDNIDNSLGTTKRKLFNYNVFDSWEKDPRQAKIDLAHLVKLTKNGELRPIITERIPLNKVAQAHDFLDVKQPHGFVLCEPWIIGKKASCLTDNDNGAFPTSEVLW